MAASTTAMASMPPLSDRGAIATWTGHQQREKSRLLVRKEGAQFFCKCETSTFVVGLQGAPDPDGSGTHGGKPPMGALPAMGAHRHAPHRCPSAISIICRFRRKLTWADRQLTWPARQKQGADLCRKPLAAGTNPWERREIRRVERAARMSGNGIGGNDIGGNGIGGRVSATALAGEREHGKKVGRGMAGSNTAPWLQWLGDQAVKLEDAGAIPCRVGCQEIQKTCSEEEEAEEEGKKGLREMPALPSSADVASEAEELAAGEGVFNWLRAWYPVAMADSLDTRLPHARTILGRRLVLWWDGKIGKWQAFLDMCPHRLAPLSEGRIHESGGLQCCYHGWVFDGTGACTLIPQAPKDGDETAEKQGQRSNSELVKMPQSCAVAYPCKEHQRMIWVWLDADAKQEAEANPPPTVPAIDDDYYWKDISMREFPYSYETLTENLVDPAHINFAHHNMWGGGRRDSTTRWNLRLNKVSPSSVEAMDESGVRVAFIPPILVLTKDPLVSQADSDRERPYPVILAWYCTPVDPGRSRLFWAVMVGVVPKFARKMPIWLVHVFSQLRVLDSDLMILYWQDRMRGYRRLEARSNWKSDYHMPTAADALVVSFWKWLYEQAGGSPMWPKGTDQSLPIRKDTDRELLMERKKSHVDHCTSCRGALENIEVAIVVLQTLSISLVMSVVAAIAAQVALAGHVGASIVLFAGFCALVSVGLRALRNKFFYQPFVQGLWE